MTTSSTPPTQFRIRQLLAGTLVLAVVFALARIAGLPGSIAVLSLLYLFGPIAALALSRYGRTRIEKYRIATAVLLGMLTVAFTIVAVLNSPLIAINVIPSSMFCWVPQAALIYGLRSAWKSGLRSAGVDLDASKENQGDE